MNCSQALDLLMSRLGNRTQPTLRSTCLLEMVLAQQTQLEGGLTLPWFLLSEELTTQTPSDGVERRVSLPTDFIREAEEQALLIVADDGSEKEVVKDDYDILVQKHGYDAQSTLPLEYALSGNYIHLFPIPTVQRTLRMRCYIRDAVPQDSTGSENNWLKYAADLLIAETGIVIASQHLKDPETAQTFVGMQTRARDRLFKASVARDEANRMRSAGDS